METHATLARQLDEATCPEEIFEGVLTSEELTRAYHRLARLVHPDAVAPELRDESARRFALLVTWRERATAKLTAGTLGDRKPHFDPVTLTVDGRTLTLTGILAEGLISTIYDATWDGEPEKLRVVAKLVREPGDNDLIERESDGASRDSPAVPRPGRRARVLRRSARLRPGSARALHDPRCRPPTPRRNSCSASRPGDAFTAQALRTDKVPRRRRAEARLVDYAAASADALDGASSGPGSRSRHARPRI